MPNTNKETLQKANAAITQGDYEGFLSYCTDDTTWEFVGEQTLRGKEAVRQYMAKAYREPPKFEVEQFIEEGDWLTSMGKINLQEEDGSWSSYAYCDVWRLRDGKLAALKAFVVASTG